MYQNGCKQKVVNQDQGVTDRLVIRLLSNRHPYLESRFSMRLAKLDSFKYFSVLV